MKRPRSRAAMIKYLTEHFRYHTLHSWNRSCSYAAPVKIHRLPWPDRETRMRAYDFLELDEAYEEIRCLIREFAERHNFRFQVGFNGRSSGYLVLYTGGVQEGGRVFTYLGRGLDEDEDLTSWTTSDLRERVALVWEFDRLVRQCTQAFIRFVQSHRIEEREILVRRKIRVAVSQEDSPKT